MKKCLNCNEVDVSLKATYCSDKCRIALDRRKKKGDLPEQHPEHLGEQPEQLAPRTGLTRTDQMFEDLKPGYYVFGNDVLEKECSNCGKSFETKLRFLRFDSPECQDKALVEINKLLVEAGLEPAMRGSEVPKLEFISSGISEIDEITKGFPRKRITEIFGLKGVGKTQLAMRIIKALPDLNIFYVDTENGLSEVPENVTRINEILLEKVSAAVDVALQKHYDLIVVDSIASILPRAELEGEAGETQMPLKAKLMSQWMRRINYHLAKSNAAVLFINQLRESPNPYVPKYTPGGLGVPYAASLRLELKSSKADRFEDGHWVHVEIEKSRICKPYQKTKFKLIY